MDLDQSFWKNRRVFISGHTGFKGSWLCLLLNILGAKVAGFSLHPKTPLNIFDSLRIGEEVNSVYGDIRNYKNLHESIESFQPEIVIHMAAQSLVRYSYLFPLETYETNVMGTINLFESARNVNSIRSILNVTSDKCYENNELNIPFEENDRLGGKDLYSSSKACSELLTNSYRHSFFNLNNYTEHGVGLASARAGNVIGGGDWSDDRLVPDFFRAMENNQQLVIRNPNAIRPWQHVLDPLCGYLLLLEHLVIDGVEYSDAWNFGPKDTNHRSTGWLISELSKNVSYTNISIQEDEKSNPYESNYLSLCSKKSLNMLGWNPKWDIFKAVNNVCSWHKAYKNNLDMNEYSKKQIMEYLDG